MEYKEGLENWSYLENQGAENSTKEYYPEIDNHETDFKKSMHSIGPTDQGDYDSCAVWALSNAITRAFSVYYEFTRSDKRNIVWNEDSKTNCIQYKKNTPSYKYCILFNFFQLFIRKKAGTCEISRENILNAIQTINDDLLSTLFDMNSNIRSLGSESYMHINTFNKNRSQTRRDFKKFSKTAAFQKFVKDEKTQSLRKNKRSNKINNIRQQNISKTKDQLRARDLFDRYKKMSQREIEVKAAANESHIEDLSSMFEMLIDQNIVLKTINANDNFESAIQLINKNGYYGVIGMTFQNSWYLLFAELSKNIDRNNDIFEQLRSNNNIPIDQENYGHSLVVKRIRYNIVTDEYEYLIKNSWGADWGDNGEMWIPEGCLPTNFKIDVIYLERRAEAAAAAADAAEEYFGGKIKSRKSNKYKYKKSRKSRKIRVK